MKTIKNKKYLKGDWGYFKENSQRLIEIGFGKEAFSHYTLRHKIRLFIGIHGQMQDGSYCFGNFDKFPKFLQKPLYKFMYYIGDFILNRLIGFAKLKS